MKLITGRTLGTLLREAKKALGNHKYEVSPQGIFLPKARAFIGGVFTGTYTDPAGQAHAPVMGFNRVTAEGLNRLLGLLGNHSSGAALYIAPFSGDVTPADGWTGVNFAANSTEFAAYTPTTRVPWTTLAPTTKQLTNAAALAAATITFTAGGPYTVRGAGLLSNSTKSSNTGFCVAASRFGADLTGMAAGGKLALQYDLSALDESDA